MTDKEKLRELVGKAAEFALPSNTKEWHLDMFTIALMAYGVRPRKQYKSKDGDT